MNMVNRNIIAWLVVVSIFPRLVLAALPGESGKDLQIDSEYEQFLLDSLAPVFIPDESALARDKQVPPTSLSWTVKHSAGLYDDQNQKRSLWESAGKSNAVAEFIETSMKDKFQFAEKFLSLPESVRYGKTGRDEMTWDRAIANRHGAFGRVWLPDINLPIASVQYFMFLPFNEVLVGNSGVGSHEGDWLCLDLDVDISERAKPKVTRAYYHNHGQVMAVPGDKIPRDSTGRIAAYMEAGSNELWPSVEDRLPEGTELYAAKTIPLKRPHRGNDRIRYVMTNVLNVGTSLATRTNAIAATDKANEIKLFYLPIRWGASVSNCPPFFSTDNPQSPAYQSKMWSRSFLQNNPEASKQLDFPRISFNWLETQAQKIADEYSKHLQSEVAQQHIVLIDAKVIKARLIPIGNMTFIGIGPNTTQRDGKKIGCISVHFCLSVRVKLQGGKMKVAEAETTQLYEVKLIPRLAGSKVELQFEQCPPKTSEHGAGGGYLEKFVADKVAKELTALCKKRIEFRQVDEIFQELSPCIPGLAGLVSIAIAKDHVTASLGGSTDGWAIPSFNTGDEGAPLRGSIRCQPRLTQRVPEATFEVYSHKAFNGPSKTIAFASVPFGQVERIPGGIKTTSIAYNIPEGEVVRLFEKHASPENTGAEFTLVGSGEIAHVGHYHMDNKINFFRREKIGDPPGSRNIVVLKEHRSPGPSAKEADKKKEGRRLPIQIDKLEPLENYRISELEGGRIRNKAGGVEFDWDNKATSLEWDLKPGVVVILIEHSDTGRHMLLHGRNRIDDLTKRGFDDLASSIFYYE